MTSCGRCLSPVPSADALTHELLILPSTFVGLDPFPGLNSAEFTITSTWPSASLLAETFATVHVHHPNTNVARLMSVYYISYVGFLHHDAEPEVKKYWWHLVARCMSKP